MLPDLIVDGGDDFQGTDKLRELYPAFNRNHDRIIVMDFMGEDLTKYVANVMLATQFSFMNKIANFNLRAEAS